MLLKYAVECALDSWQTFSFSWIDTLGQTHNEAYHGSIALATSWATAPLDFEGQAMVSACIASRANYYGISVIISMRSPDSPLQFTSYAELTAYSKVEGAFWGNIFAPTPYLRACYTAANVQNSRSWGRECATGHVAADGTISGCGMIDIIGACEAHCKMLSWSRFYYPSCTDPLVGKVYDVVTAALPTIAGM